MRAYRSCGFRRSCCADANPQHRSGYPPGIVTPRAPWATLGLPVRPPFVHPRYQSSDTAPRLRRATSDHDDVFWATVGFYLVPSAICRLARHCDAPHVTFPLWNGDIPGSRSRDKVHIGQPALDLVYATVCDRAATARGHGAQAKRHPRGCARACSWSVAPRHYRTRDIGSGDS